MAVIPRALTRLIESFEKLPGIGPKTAQRLSYYLLHMPQEELDNFSSNISGLKKNTTLCSICRIVGETDPCSICAMPSRDVSTVCVVEQPTDVLSIERTGKYTGVYHVLHGAIDPLNNIGPDELYITDLFRRLKNDVRIRELILATNPNMEGEATAMYLNKEIGRINQGSGRSIAVTRLAHGLPVGADIEYADDVTLSRALEGRTQF